ncbi:hypothetical protein J6590_015874 [Homalodisca vitripennis]|nr:hypothetical protein J6590_015874 [Homalodisca vitripennis]
MGCTRCDHKARRNEGRTERACGWVWGISGPIINVSGSCPPLVVNKHETTVVSVCDVDSLPNLKQCGL